MEEAKEVKDSISEIIKKRVTNPIYSHLLIFECFFHINFFVTLFFVSENNILDKTGLLKNDYLLKTLFNHDTWSSIIISCIFWLLPILLTYFSVWLFPKWFFIPATERDEAYDADRVIIKISHQRRIEQERVKLEEQTAKKITAVAKQVVEDKKIKNADPKIQWSADYDSFAKNGYVNIFLNFINKFYSGEKYLHNFSPNDISYFDALDLIEIDQNRINSISDKGKYFALRIKDREKFQHQV